MKHYLEPLAPALLAAFAFPLLSLSGCAPAEDGHDGHDHGAEEEGAHDDHGDEDQHADEDGHGDHEEHEEGHVELTETQFRSAGIEVEAAKSARVSEVLILSGTVAPNADAVLHVTPRVSGQVRSVSKHLGEMVKLGEVLCVLDSVQLGTAVADYLRDVELVTAGEETLAREKELFEGRLAALRVVLEGAIDIQERIYKREVELQEKALSTVRPMLEAQKAYQMAQLELEKQLTELRSERDTRVLELEVRLRTRRIDLTAATHRLRTLGLTAEEVEGIDSSSPLLSGEYRMTSPGGGIVVSRHAFAGEFVTAGTKVYIIENLASVWFVASAFEDQLQTLRRGQKVTVALDAFPASPVSGSVSFIDYHVDPVSRSVGVRITLDNEQLGGWSEDFPIRPGMFGRAELETASRMADIVLPERALVHEDAGDFVFVQVEPLAFERRDVTVINVAGDMVEITSGLEQGDMVAVSGTFLLKSAERQSELGGGHSH